MKKSDKIVFVVVSAFIILWLASYLFFVAPFRMGQDEDVTMAVAQSGKERNQPPMAIPTLPDGSGIVTARMNPVMNEHQEFASPKGEGFKPVQTNNNQTVNQ